MHQDGVTGLLALVCLFGACSGLLGGLCVDILGSVVAGCVPGRLDAWAGGGQPRKPPYRATRETLGGEKDKCIRRITIT